MISVENTECMNCGEEFQTYWIIDEGIPTEFFCGSECMEEYYSIESRRDRLIETMERLETNFNIRRLTL